MATKKKQTKSKAVVGYGVILDMGDDLDELKTGTFDFDTYEEARGWVEQSLYEADNDFTICKITIEPQVKVRKVVNIISIEEPV